MLPGLRSLFQRAVGAADELEFEMALSRSLGFHAETPALASFLGKAPILRGVMVWDPDAVVDIDGVDDEQARTTLRWRMPFSHRNIFRDTLPSTSPAPPETLQPRPPSNTSAPAQSRFHILARIVVVDRSLWLPPEQRGGPDTHKWMISVDALLRPWGTSLVFDPSTFFRRATSRPSSSASRSNLRRDSWSPPRRPSPSSAPPKRPPRALILRLVRRRHAAEAPGALGRGAHRAPVPSQGWLARTQLDRMQSRGVVYGEEQMVDVELDRGTVFLPQRSGYIPSNSRALRDLGLQKTRHAPLELASRPPFQLGQCLHEEEAKCPSERYSAASWENVLKHLVDRFPLTLQRGKPPVPALPYKLVANPAQFSALVMGRKKAVEVRLLKVGITFYSGVAPPLRDAYNDAVLSSNGYFPWGAATIKQEPDMQKRVPAVFVGWPTGCTLRSARDPSPMKLWLPPSGEVSSDSYPGGPRARRYSPSVHNGTWDSRAPTLLAVVDPALVAAVRTLVSALKLRQVYAAVAPHAMLALLTRQFVRALVKTALEAFARDRHRAMVIMGCLARIGVPLEQPPFVKSSEQESTCEDGSRAAFKLIINSWDFYIFAALASHMLQMYPTSAENPVFVISSYARFTSFPKRARAAHRAHSASWRCRTLRHSTMKKVSSCAVAGGSASVNLYMWKSMSKQPCVKRVVARHVRVHPLLVLLWRLDQRSLGSAILDDLVVQPKATREREIPRGCEPIFRLLLVSPRAHRLQMRYATQNAVFAEALERRVHVAPRYPVEWSQSSNQYAVQNSGQ
ncbi:hypothetical protein GGX14DRAFT_699505 [Mycena pura]|uniref:YEATS domain-containing protein n=1 Tax=Mycena pura TaxID=153505 RepID=A0AAD6V336_9AGAR|nr:hypothetical protein GGX14DRAFT_699505 [Mycena pura]